MNCIHEEFVQVLDNKEDAIAVFLDLSKISDIVNQEVFLLKLPMYAVHGVIRAAMSNLMVKDCVRPSLGLCCSKRSYILTTCLHSDNFQLDIFNAAGPQCHFIISVASSVRI